MSPEMIDFSPIRGKHILVALSGGADSTALLTLLCRKREEFQLKITAAHLNHMIRGCEADRDETFCRNLCKQLGIELICSVVDIPALSADSGIGIETCARSERYRFLRNAKNECHAELIALAHHSDDQIETVLMHLFRGTGPEGICGMSQFSSDLYRPLLICSKSEIIEWLRSSGMDWCEDSTNSVDDNPRNALRLNVLPEIRKSYPAFGNAIVKFTQSAQTENAFLSRLTDEYLDRSLLSYPVGFRLDISSKPDDAILRRAIRKICGRDLTFEKTEAILQLAKQGHGKTEYSGSKAIEAYPSCLWFMTKIPTVPVPVPVHSTGCTSLPDIARINLIPGVFPIQKDDPLTECVDLSALAGACLRTRKNGDRIRPLGSPGSRLLSDCMIDRKLERPLRDSVPLIANGNRVLWCLGIGISDELKITSQTQNPGRLDIQLMQSEVIP